MSKTKILRILSSFKEGDWKECRNYITATSKTDNKRKKLFRYYYNLRHEWTEEVGEYDEKCRRVGATSAKDWLNIHSELMPLLENFLIHQSLSLSLVADERSFLLAQAYRNRGLLKLFESVSLDALKKLNEDTKIDLWDSLLKLRIHHAMAYSAIADRDQALSSFISSLSLLKDFYQNLSKFYRIEKENKERILGVVFDLEGSSQLEPFKFIKFLSELVLEKNQGGYYYLESVLYDRFDDLSQELRESLCTYLINYGYSQIKSGDEAFGPKVGRLQEYSFDKKLYTGKMTVRRAVNLVEALSKFELNYDTINYIDRIVQEVEFSDKVSLKNILLACHYFCVHDYDIALELINHPDTKLIDRYLACNARLMKAGSMCMTEGYDSIFNSVIDSTKKFLYRHKESFTNKQYYGAINFLTALLMKQTSASEQELLSFIRNSEYFIHSHWFKKALKL